MTGGVPKRPENRAIGGVVNVPGLHQPDRVAMRLDALTSLRFFAAALIVLHHSRESFSIGQGWEGVRFGQGVSFFFVLSGFILCYVYPRLGSPAAIGEFLRARIARIWPAHVLGFLAAVILLSVPLTPTAFLNLAMVHSWVPSLQTYFSYNAPSWSIATEFCFYLLFPILIRDFSRTWWWKFGLSLAIVLALAKLAGLLGVPRLAEEGLTVHWLLYINPLARLAEFVLGMVLCALWRRNGGFQHWGRGTATSMELGALATCLGGLVGTQLMLASPLRLGYPASLWLGTSGSLLWFGFLVLVVASQRGWLAQLLRFPPVVLLGEISYSIFLLHWILFRFYSANKLAYVGLPVWAAWTLFCALTVICAYASWRFVETPARAILRRRRSDPPPAVEGAGGHAGKRGNVTRFALPVLTLFSFVGLIFVPLAGVVQPLTDKAPAGTITPGGGCNVEIVEYVNRVGEAVDPASGYLRLTGWAADLEAGTVPQEVYVRMTTPTGETLYIQARRLGTHTPRPDLAQAFANLGLSLSGWSLVADISSLAPGKYGVAVLQGEGNRFLVCQRSTSLNITPKGT